MRTSDRVLLAALSLIACHVSWFDTQLPYHHMFAVFHGAVGLLLVGSIFHRTGRLVALSLAAAFGSFVARSIIIVVAIFDHQRPEGGFTNDRLVLAAVQWAVLAWVVWWSDLYLSPHNRKRR